MDELLEFCAIILCCLLGSAALSILVIVMLNPAVHKSCKEKAVAMDVNYKYGFWEGCLYEVGGKYIPHDMLKSIDMLDK